MVKNKQTLVDQEFHNIDVLRSDLSEYKSLEYRLETMGILPSNQSRESLLLFSKAENEYLSLIINIKEQAQDIQDAVE